MSIGVHSWFQFPESAGLVKVGVRQKPDALANGARFCSVSRARVALTDKLEFRDARGPIRMDRRAATLEKIERLGGLRRLFESGDFADFSAWVHTKAIGI